MDQLVESQQTKPCRSCKKALGHLVMTVFGRNYRAHLMFCEVFSITYIHFSYLYFQRLTQEKDVNLKSFYQEE